MGDVSPSMWGAIAVGVIIVIALVIVLDHLREARDLKNHLKRIDERKEAYERFKQKKRASQEQPAAKTPNPKKK
jgi:heme exporter protein D